MCKELEQIETKFKEISGIDIDLSIFPLSESDLNVQTVTNKLKKVNFGEVFTPLWLVDRMILKCADNVLATGEKMLKAQATLDLCAGYGQFTIRMLRCINIYKESQKEEFEVNKWLSKHSVSEIQLGSVYKLLYIFGSELNIYIGDSRFLNKLKESQSGILIYNGKNWQNITKSVRKTFGNIKSYDENEEALFCKWLKIKLVNRKKTQPLLKGILC